MLQVEATGTILDRIVAQTAIDVAERKKNTPIERLSDQIARGPAPVDLRAALQRTDVAVIAEFKRASPSRGRFPVEASAAEVTAAYVEGGAAGISCLTDTPFFQGTLDDLTESAAAARAAHMPTGVLRKDFMIDPYQVIEARAYGASCILLIVACLPDSILRELQALAWEHGMACLVEVHDEREMERAIGIGANLIGINNRDLHSFEVSLDVTRRLAPMVPSDVVLVGESGIFTHAHVEEMGAAGVDAVLVGESLIVQPDRAAAVRALTGARKSCRG